MGSETKTPAPAPAQEGEDDDSLVSLNAVTALWAQWGGDVRFLDAARDLPAATPAPAPPAEIAEGRSAKELFHRDVTLTLADVAAMRDAALQALVGDRRKGAAVAFDMIGDEVARRELLPRPVPAQDDRAAASWMPEIRHVVEQGNEHLRAGRMSEAIAAFVAAAYAQIRLEEKLATPSPEVSPEKIAERIARIEAHNTDDYIDDIVRILSRYSITEKGDGR